MKIIMLMPDLALIGAQKMGLNFIENIDNSAIVDKQLVVLSDHINDLNQLHYIPKYIPLKQNFNGIRSKVDTIKAIYVLRKVIKKYHPDLIISVAPIMNIFLILSMFWFKKRPKLIIEEHQHLTQ